MTRAALIFIARVSLVGLIVIAVGPASSSAHGIELNPASLKPRQYTAELLPTFPGFPYPRISAINNNGHAAGTNHACPFTLSCLSQTYFYDGEQLIHTSQAMLDAVPPGYSGIPVALDLNNADHALIRMGVPDLGEYHYLWDEGETVLISANPAHVPGSGPLVPLHPPPGRCWAINDNGTVVGTVDVSGFLWERERGVIGFIVPPPGFTSVSARGLNNFNHVVGAVATGDQTRAFLWTGGAFTILPPLPGHLDSEAIAVNDDGFVIGTSRAPSDGNFVYSLVMWHEGKIVDSVSLDFPDGLLQFPTALNANADVVGYYWPTADASQHFGFRWSAAAGFATLNGSVVNIPDLNIWAAEGINDAGQIAAWGDDSKFNGGAFILTPIIQTPGDVTGNGIVDVDDLLAVINAWGPCGNPCPADLTGNGVVDVDDLLIVINNWG